MIFSAPPYITCFQANREYPSDICSTDRRSPRTNTNTIKNRVETVISEKQKLYFFDIRTTKYLFNKNHKIYFLYVFWHPDIHIKFLYFTDKSTAPVRHPDSSMSRPFPELFWRAEQSIAHSYTRTKFPDDYPLDLTSTDAPFSHQRLHLHLSDQPALWDRQTKENHHHSAYDLYGMRHSILTLRKFSVPKKNE